MANLKAHYEGTGREIWEQSGGKVDGFTCSAGTAGTIAGVSRYLKEKDSSVVVYQAEPQSSALHNYLRTGEYIDVDINGYKSQAVERKGTKSILEGIGKDSIT